MPKTSITQDERQLIKLVEKFLVPDEAKTGWAERIRNGEMSEELADEMRQKLSEHSEDEREQSMRTRQLVELSSQVKRWRLSSQSRNFGRK